MYTHWCGDAYEKLITEKNHNINQAYIDKGMTLAADGSEDHLLKLKGLEDMEFPKERPAAPPPRLSKKERREAAIAQAIEANTSFSSHVMEAEKCLVLVADAILSALIFLHCKRHLLHLDIKPQNVLLSQRGEVKLTDFGTSSTLHECDLDVLAGTCQETPDSTQRLLGSVCYTSPQRIDNGRGTAADDVWSFGITLLEAALGRYPYNTSSGPFDLLLLQISQEDPPLPSHKTHSPEFFDFVGCCLQKEVDKRPSVTQLYSHPFIQRRKTSSLTAHRQSSLSLLLQNSPGGVWK
ncbi:hypothetical protein CYMTET_49192 [Cymbomonas tetramitiformis]|uniref:mitogen-activated protein kinase kinase n=1 Tax=Cymbomonas tetramitiformis TaxID=36881 RepID=A0AAE0BRZ2_9CHLO|nr:hypothetical protein CYMTET_49192 [Cymbomonas tetramitiformis]